MDQNDPCHSLRRLDRIHRIVQNFSWAEHWDLEFCFTSDATSIFDRERGEMRERRLGLGYRSYGSYRTYSKGCAVLIIHDSPAWVDDRPEANGT